MKDGIKELEKWEIDELKKGNIHFACDIRHAIEKCNEKLKKEFNFFIKDERN